eukprot:scaffold231771_cov31-Tisochrysis_lutea.AAC.4
MHADLHPGNILLRTPSLCGERSLALIDAGGCMRPRQTHHHANHGVVSANALVSFSPRCVIVDDASSFFWCLRSQGWSRVSLRKRPLPSLDSSMPWVLGMALQPLDGFYASLLLKHVEANQQRSSLRRQASSHH